MAYRFLIFDSFYKLPPLHNLVRKSPCEFSKIACKAANSLQILLGFESLLLLVRLLVETLAGSSGPFLVKPRSS